MPIPALVGAGLIAGGASLVGSIIGAGAQASANSTNLQAVRETNQANRDLMEYQNQWNLDQWNRENEYNSASAQRQRLEQAGLNPYLMMSGGDAGSASSVRSASATMQAGQVQPVNYAAGLGNAVGDALGTYMNMRMANAQVAQMDAAVQGQKISNLIEASKLPYAGMMNKVMLDQSLQTLEGFKLDNALKDLQKSSNELQYSLDVQFGTKERAQALGISETQQQLLRKQIDVATQNIANMQVQQNLTRSQIATEAKKQILLSAQTAGVKLSNKQVQALMPSVVKQSENQARILQMSANEATRYNTEESKPYDSRPKKGMSNFQRKYYNSQERDYWSTLASPVSSFFNPASDAIGSVFKAMK